jgi:hypothetical protein
VTPERLLNPDREPQNLLRATVMQVQDAGDCVHDGSPEG